MEPCGDRTNPPPARPKVLLGKYELGRLLGRGTHAKVYYAQSLADGRGIAVKVIDKCRTAGTTMEPRIVREASIMHRLNHPNIVKLHEVMATKSKIYLVMEHAKGGELFSQISGGRPLTEPVARRYFQQLASALHYCHLSGVTHRDIKPQNLLLDQDGNLKVSDFGLSALPEQLRDGHLHTACGTPVYAAPEVLRGKGYNGAKADAWSCGVILFVLLAGYLPFDDANIALMYQKIHSRDLEFPHWFSRSVRRVISRLLDPNAYTRMTIEGLMQASWLRMCLESNHVNFNLSESLKHGKIDDFKTTSTMNAFDIISLSSGLDLSGLFEREKKTAKRFTSTESAEKILKTFEEIGVTLDYNVDRRGVVVLVKNRTVFSVTVSEMASLLLLVEIEGTCNQGGVSEEVQWKELESQLEDLVTAWHCYDNQNHVQQNLGCHQICQYSVC